MKKQAGFTLIEIIVVLIIGGIMMTVAGMAIVTGLKGYFFVRDNASITQNAQLAMTRLSRELMELTNVTTAETSRITFSRLGLSNSQTIYFDLNYDTIKIVSGIAASGGDILVDRVNNFALGFYNSSDALWVEGFDDIQDLSYITIALDLERTEGSIISFSTTVNPRNTGG